MLQNIILWWVLFVGVLFMVTKTGIDKFMGGSIILYF